jgi:hypothetical protein
MTERVLFEEELQLDEIGSNRTLPAADRHVVEAKHNQDELDAVVRSGRCVVAGAAGLIRIGHTEFVECAVERHSRRIELVEVVAGVDSQDNMMIEIVDMELQRLEVLLERDTLWIAMRQVQGGWPYTDEDNRAGV